jgi:hypothetical protein
MRLIASAPPLTIMIRDSEYRKLSPTRARYKKNSTKPTRTIMLAMMSDL